MRYIERSSLALIVYLKRHVGKSARLLINFCYFAFYCKIPFIWLPSYKEVDFGEINFRRIPCSFNSRTNLCQSARKSGRPNTRLILARGFIRTCTTAQSDALFFSKRVSKSAILLAKENETDKRKKKRIGLRHIPVTGEQSETRSNIRRTKSYWDFQSSLCSKIKQKVSYESIHRVGKEKKFKCNRNGT